MATLEVLDLVKAYHKGRRVVDHVSLEVSTGEVVGLLGPNGAGKTTVFQMVMGLIQSNFGQIRLNGKDITKLPMHIRAQRGIGYLPQEPSVFRKLTVKENIMAVIEILGQARGGEDQHTLAERVLRELNLIAISDAKAHSISGGERRRVEISRALVLSPLFLLLDEPFAGIDPIAVSDIQKVIRGLKEKAIGVLVTDHNVRETLAIVDRAYIIAHGRILESGTPEIIARSDRVRRGYLGEDFSLAG